MHTLSDHTPFLGEIQGGNSFGCLLAYDSYFSSMDYKVLQSQNSGNLIRCVKMLYNGKIELYYITEGLCSVARLLSKMTPDMLVDILVNVFESVLEVKNNGFLHCQNVAISWDKIYMDLATRKVKLVYFPVKQMQFESYGSFESALRSEMIKLVNRIGIPSNEQLDRLAVDLTNGMLTMEDLYRNYKGAKLPRTVVTKADAGSQNKKTSSEDSSENSVLRLVSVNTPEPFEAVLDQPNMMLGRKRGAVDILVPFNRMIGRIHCRIVNQDGMYSIEDQGSVNGTYVNGVRIEPYKSTVIKKGDIIRLADSGFRLV